ncbi:MAG TPA: DUF4097 family beta strand repeat-containing protein [Longimicrobiales bacterium]|nr:DUF4097 family beta strand repeat-containing protein [Longimicrobiales bacterium]
MSVTLLAGLLAVAMTQQQFDTTFSVRSDSRIEVETFGGEIKVRSWNRNDVRVQAQHGRREVIEVDARGSSVRIEAEGHMGIARDVRFLLTVPRSAHIEASGVQTDIDIEGVTGNIDAETVQGNIRVIGGSRLSLESVEGDLTISGARGAVQASTVNRGIRVSDVHGDLDLETVNGPIIVQKVQATSVDASTVNGRIVYDGTLRDGGHYSLATHNGAIWVVVPGSTNASVSVSTFNGELDTSFEIPRFESNARRRSYNFVLGNGKARLDLETFGGDINLRRPGENLPTTVEPPRAPAPPRVRVRD